MNIFIQIEALLSLVLVVVVYIDDVYPSHHHQGYAHQSHPSADFTHHTIVEPILYHKKSEKRIHTTKESNGFHVEHLFVKLNADNQTFELDLVLNKQLLAEGFFHRYQENGSDKIFRHNSKDSELCEYQGKIRGKINSWVALSTCEGLIGVIFDGKELHYISSQRNSSASTVYNSHIEHFFYSQSNIKSHNKSCGEKNVDEQMFRYKRYSAQKKTVHVPYNADKLTKYVELILVVDNKEYIAFGRNKYRVVQHGKAIFNMVNAFYSPLNIFVVLVGIVIWSERDEISLSNGGTILSNFANYRKSKLLKDHPNDNAQLLGKFNLGGSNVGRGYTGAICSHENSVAVSKDHSNVIGIMAETIAHELGHNFGLPHDDKSCKCPETYCIMSPVSTTATSWSSCSLFHLMLSFTKGLDYCLRNEPKKLLDYPICGNGFVERGEECDCGLPEYCTNACCNATSCLLKPNATCAAGSCCDLSTCKLKGAGTICRSADYECDLPEYCTGKSEFCPENTYKMDTEPCANGKAYCYNGFCRTRTDQCKLIWGLGGESCEETGYNQNMRADESGHCGYDKFSRTFTKCQNEDKFCGLLQCRSSNDDPEFGLWESINPHFSNLNKSLLILCRSLSSLFDHNVVDPSMVADGAPCGDGKMCVNQKCLSVSSLRTKGRDCSNNCKNGWCNNLGHCHCKDGFAPPNCGSSGPGGSEDSGPASSLNRGLNLMGLYITILVILLIIAACVVIWYWLKPEDFFKISRTINTSFRSFIKYLSEIFTYPFQACRQCLVKVIYTENKVMNVPENNEHKIQSKPQIVIERSVLVSTTNLEITKSLTITEAREKLRKTGNFRRHEIGGIASANYPKKEKKEANVSSLANAFENPNFKEQI
ncbi:hypothetical protein WA026_012054 [Henosepilachna vigintioctopunctata]|uniref:Uncharacterized protein n=1 Tax=Henosepilachna vigintioctopunctata TaxID=420089 RepID=A0AAW1V617_9CUCU